MNMTERTSHLVSLSVARDFDRAALEPFQREYGLDASIIQTIVLRAHISPELATLDSGAKLDAIINFFDQLKLLQNHYHLDAKTFSIVLGKAYLSPEFVALSAGEKIKNVGAFLSTLPVQKNASEIRFGTKLGIFEALLNTWKTDTLN